MVKLAEYCFSIWRTDLLVREGRVYLERLVILGFARLCLSCGTRGKRVLVSQKQQTLSSQSIRVSRGRLVMKAGGLQKIKTMGTL